MERWFLLALALLGGCTAESGRRPSPSLPARKVLVVSAERSSRPVMTEVVGTVRPVRSATIAPVVGGTVAEVRVTLGSSVRPGDVLVKLSARESDARLEQSRAVFALAKQERDRANVLRAQEAISAAQYDTVLSQFRVAEARQAEAMTMAEHSVLRAPFAGVIAAKLVNVGDTAMPGQGLLQLEAPSVLRFEVRVPEGSAAGLSVGQSLPVLLDAVARELQARVAEIEPASDDRTRTRLVKLDLPPVPGLRSGQFGRLLLTTGSSLGVWVPPEAVVRHGQLETLFVADSGSARLRLVRTGREREGRLEIVSGLTGDERVIASGTNDLVDGQPIEEAR